MSDNTNTEVNKSNEVHLDDLKNEILNNLSKIEFKDFFAKAAKCSGNNSRILLIVKPEIYDRIDKTKFLEKEYFEFLVKVMRDKIRDNMDLVARVSHPNKDDEGENKIEHLAFLSTRKLKVLLVAENKNDYLCIRRWAISRVKDIAGIEDEMTILALDNNGMEELFEKEYSRVLKKSIEQEKSLATSENNENNENNEESNIFSKVMISLKKKIAPSNKELNAFINLTLANQELFIKDGTFNLKSFETIPSSVIKNLASLAQGIKKHIDDKDEVFNSQIETIKKTITGIDDDKDLLFFLLRETVKDISFTIVKKLYLSNGIVQEYLNEALLNDFEDVTTIIINPKDKNIARLIIIIKDMITPHLNTGWESVGSFNEN